MERTCCVDVPALPLQLLLRGHPQWREHPTVVVKDDRPQGVILWANALARRCRILPGMSFASARSLADTLRAAVVEPEDIKGAVDELTAALAGFSPRVEPAVDHHPSVPEGTRASSTRGAKNPMQPGVFWVDPEGLSNLYGSHEHWAHTMLGALRQLGFVATVVVGFHRFRSYALARTRQGAWVIPDPHTEARWISRVPLSHLDLSPDLRDQLRVLGVKTLGDFLRLPAAELRSRFGAEAAALHARASDRWSPLRPRTLVDPITSELQFEPPDNDYTRLLFALKGSLHELTRRLAARGQAMSALHLTMTLDHAGQHEEWIEPAAPTLDVPMLIDLVRLRMESLRLPAAVESVDIRLEGVRASGSQLAMFRTHTRRDLDAAGRALARVRALMGPQAVTRAQLRAAHLPEASYAWEPIVRPKFPRPYGAANPPVLMRRVLARPVALPSPPRHEPEAWLGRRGAVKSMHGPFRVSGGWWVRTVERDYYYAQTQHGEILWLYYDRPRRAWFLHGTVD
ncbi:MAG: DNA polymerase Y family protein [Myxococcota bacterium]